MADPDLPTVASSSAEPPTVLDLPVGLPPAVRPGPGAVRVERDALGEVEVPADVYWGAQTERARRNFPVGEPARERMPLEVVHALAAVKQAAAAANVALGVLPQWQGDLVRRVGGEVRDGLLDDQFPLPVWQTGSGTQTNMNVNEVVANRANQLVGAPLGGKSPIHPNDTVNASQSSNDAFPTAVHVAVAGLVAERLLPAGAATVDLLLARAEQWADVVKVGRTHVQDAVPMPVGREWGAWGHQLRRVLAQLAAATEGLAEVPLGGTAVGTGLNAPAGFAERAAAELAALTGRDVRPAADLVAAVSGAEALVAVSGALRGVAVVLAKLANDLRWLGSGPRAGLHELALPPNEPGSSIMPGKVNPTQAEMVLQVCAEAMGCDVAAGLAGAQGVLQLNTMRPLLALSVLRPARLLADAMDSLRQRCLVGVELDLATLADDVARSVMPVTALAPVLGYDRAAALALAAVRDGVTLREAALAGGVDAGMFDEVVQPRRLARPHDHREGASGP